MSVRESVRLKLYRKPVPFIPSKMIEYLLPLLIPLGLVFLFRLINKQHKPPIFGIYQQNTKYYWFKFIFMYTVLRIKQLFTHIKRLYFVEVGKSCDGTVQVHTLDAVLEKKYYLGDNPHGIDAVSFNGVSTKGETIICGIARRPRNVDAFVYLKLKDEELLLSPVLPDTYQEQSSGENGDYKINGLEIVNFIPMRTWKINYKGEMKCRSNPAKVIKIEMYLTWSATFGPFNYSTQMAPASKSRDMAREKWSRGYFKLLNKLHLTHYQQMGCIEGTVSVDGIEQIINIPCIRDHRYGPFQDWNTYHRYVQHFIFLENGDSIAVGSVCQPPIFSHLTTGYLCRKSDQAVLPVQSCEFQLYHHGENQMLPKEYGFLFTAGRERFEVHVQVEDEDALFIGKSRQVKVYERWSTVVVNGIKGRACVEWMYNNVQ